MTKPSPGRSAFYSRKTILAVFCFAVIFTVIAHIFLALISDTQNRSMIKRGDFPAFYAAGQIVREGQGPLLYNPELQKILENQSWPSFHGAYLYFSYPAWFAAFMAPLTYLPPLSAKFIFVLFLLFILERSLKLSAKIAPVWNTNPLMTAAFLISFFPLTAGILGGQNTALSMLCYSALLYGVKRGGRLGMVIAGAAVGMWSFKIQFAGFFLVFFCLSGLYTAALCAVSVMLLQYGLGGLVSGWNWPQMWFDAARHHAMSDLKFNAYQMISFHGVSCAAAKLFGGNDLTVKSLGAVAVFFSAFLFFRIAQKLWKTRFMAEPERSNRQFFYFALAGPAVLLMSPHALFYDVGIVLLSAAYFIDPKNKADVYTWLVFWALGTAGMIFKQYLPIQPVFILCFLVFVRLGSKSPHSPSRHPISR